MARHQSTEGAARASRAAVLVRSTKRHAEAVECLPRGVQSQARAPRIGGGHSPRTGRPRVIGTKRSAKARNASEVGSLWVQDNQEVVMGVGFLRRGRMPAKSKAQ